MPDPAVRPTRMDGLRKDHVGAYGNDWIETPNLDALAKESLRFTRAYPESIPSIPARCGKWPRTRVGVTSRKVAAEKYARDRVDRRR